MSVTELNLKPNWNWNWTFQFKFGQIGFKLESNSDQIGIQIGTKLEFKLGPNWNSNWDQIGIQIGSKLEFKLGRSNWISN